MQSQNRNLLIILIVAALLLCCCCFVVLGAFFGIGLFARSSELISGDYVTEVTRVVTVVPESNALAATATPRNQATLKSPESGAPATKSAATPQPAITAQPTASGSTERQLVEAKMPERDQRELALRLKTGVTDIPVVVNATPPTFKVGDKQVFWVSNSDTDEHHQVTATLKYLNDHVYMWVDDTAKLSDADLKKSADRFANQTYPTNREFFGSELSPGVDNDPRLHILHTRGMGKTVAGYYSSADEYSHLVNPYSNEKEMFYISADSGNAKPNSTFYDGTLAHEFQHMIHWANDRNEDSWVNEGMSELASYLNGFDPGGADAAYMQKPDTQLTTWSDPSLGNAEHYGASYLFMQYFLDRFGEDLTKAVVASPENGIAGFNAALSKAGRPERFDDIYADWVIANYLNQRDADAEGRYGYKEIKPDTPKIEVTQRRFPVTQKAEVSQYGADYIRLQGNGDVKIDFTGQNVVGLVDAKPNGAYAWWSNRGDDSDATLTRAFDLRNAKSPTLNFSAWYDLEDGWDYGYVTVSTDGGKKWQVLKGQQATDKNPVGNAFGPGYTGISGGGKTPKWVQEKVDLTPFAGQQIQLRFEYVTDDAVNGPGFMVDDISIPEIGYSDGGEKGTGGWEAAGWVLTDNQLNQGWLVQLLEVGKDGAVTLQRVPVDSSGHGQISVTGLDNLQDTVLAISALAPVTTEKASYSYSITPN
jgi:immune inhibitor A